jgi:hypothetical protein
MTQPAARGDATPGTAWNRLAETVAGWTRPGGIPPGVRAGLIAIAWAAILVAVSKMAVGHMLTMPTGGNWNDSYVYLGAASDFISHPTHLYDSAHLQVVRGFAQKTFVHPPSGLLPYLPLVPLVRLFGLPVAASVWTVIDTLALFTAVILAGRRFGLSWLTLSVATLLISLSQPARWEIDSGQINGLVLLLFVLALLRMPRRDSGVLMGLALAVKPTAPIVLLVPLLRRQPAVTVVALITLAALNLPFVPLIGVAAMVFYVGTVLPFFAGYPLHDGGNIALANVLQTWLGGGPLSRRAPFATSVPRGFEALAVLWIARIGVVILWFRAAVDRRLDVAVAVALSLATVPFLSSTIWPHYLLYVIPLALATLAASQFWLRAAGMFSLFALCWTGRPDALWVGLVVLWVAAGLLVARKLGGRVAPAMTMGTAELRRSA